MHETLEIIQTRLEELIKQVSSSIPNEEPFAIAQNNWSFPCLTRAELIEEARSIHNLIKERGGDDLGRYTARLQDYVRRLQQLQQQTVPQIWSNANHAVTAYMLTLQGLRKALNYALPLDTHSKATERLKKIAKQLRSMESRLKDLDPRTTTLGEMVERIEQAYEAAGQLPTELEDLSEAREKINKLVTEVMNHHNNVLQIKENADRLDVQLTRIAGEAESVLDGCKTTYAAATSVGLAAAFSERSNTLSKSMWFWIGGLAAALIAGSYFGSEQLRSLTELFRNPDIPTSVIFLNLLLSVLSIGAPVWFAWLSTKQIGQRFRLAEDYAFKASISRAYEGFRREAARFDKDMEAKLLASALTRLDELPLRLVETDSYGSPWHELASSGSIKQAMQLIPDFAEQVKDLASKALDTVSSTKNLPSKTSAKPQPKTANPSDEDEDEDN